MAKALNTRRVKLSICIPAYNRVRFLPALLDSVYAQDFPDFEVVICEDRSPEREHIAAVVMEYAQRYPGSVRYYENDRNLGYDGNIRELVKRASGEYCFFMGNDDVMCPGALSAVSTILARYQNVGLVLRSYAWFEDSPTTINEEIRYFREERVFAPGREAIMACFRRSGVISGYVVHRDAAHSVATDKFDGTLFYQLYLTGSVLSSRCAVFTPEILVLCRANDPEFGFSDAEKEKFTPGCYTPEARLRMVSGALCIAQELSTSQGVDLVEEISRDYANYFYPYIRDQLNLPLRSYLRLYRGFSRMGFSRYPMFHLYFVLGYVLGEHGFDRMTSMIRKLLRRSPQFSSAR